MSCVPDQDEEIGIELASASEYKLVLVPEPPEEDEDDEELPEEPPLAELRADEETEAVAASHFVPSTNFEGAHCFTFLLKLLQCELQNETERADHSERVLQLAFTCIASVLIVPSAQVHVALIYVAVSFTAIPVKLATERFNTNERITETAIMPITSNAFIFF